MGCCSEGRRTLAARNAPPPVKRVEPALPWASPSAIKTTQRVLALRYPVASPIVIRGASSGKLYEFSAARPMQAVEPGDVAALLRNRLLVEKQRA